VPDLSLFHEVNLVGNRSELNRTDVLDELSLDTPSTTIERILGDVNINIVQGQGDRNHDDGLELNEF
jgi:hypothetical protein